MFPKQSKTRELVSLDGIWDFYPDFDDAKKNNEWSKGSFPSAILMPVPSSYNDIGVSETLRDHVGDVWYKRTFFIPESWERKRVGIYFGSVSHNTVVYLNGKEVCRNKGGFLPFEADLTNNAICGESNTIVVCVNNELSWQTLPPGEVVEYIGPDGKKRKIQKQQHDFFNYGGIHRSVYLFKTEKTFIEDVTLETHFSESRGFIDYSVEKAKGDTVGVFVYDQKGVLCSSSHGEKGRLIVDNVTLWSPSNPYLYSIKIELWDKKKLVDEYSLTSGIRTVCVKDGKLLINEEAIYLKGFGKHEDSDVRGKGFDYPLAVRDYELLKWINANSYRTSHYPYSEEMMDLADRYGILIIDEVPAVGLLGQAVPAVGALNGVFKEGKIDDNSWQNHVNDLRRLVKRDKNHPSVIMWSISNEASTMEPACEDYFRRLCEVVRSIDKRPLINVDIMLIEPGKCFVSKYVDVIGLNLYFGWYSQPGNIEWGGAVLEDWLKRWYEAEKKPIIISEYGVDTVAGIHKCPSVMFSEEYQMEFLKKYHEVFDKLHFVIGEHVWNFADFQTSQGIVRVDGNKKGVFTRQRQPKLAAHYLKERWTKEITKQQIQK
ncbi:MAG: beta-glucuronidase [Lentisphaerota bacterium]